VVGAFDHTDDNLNRECSAVHRKHLIQPDDLRSGDKPESARITLFRLTIDRPRVEETLGEPCLLGVVPSAEKYKGKRFGVGAYGKASSRTKNAGNGSSDIFA
jgi:hypothetical protein